MCCPRQCGVSATSTTLPPPPPPSESPHCSVQSPVVKQTFHYPYPHRKMLHNRRLNVIIFKIIHQSYPQKYDAIFCCFFQVLILATNLKCVMTVDCTTRLYQKADNQNVNNLISCHVARHERVEKNFSSSAFWGIFKTTEHENSATGHYSWETEHFKQKSKLKNIKIWFIACALLKSLQTLDAMFVLPLHTCWTSGEIQTSHSCLTMLLKRNIYLPPSYSWYKNSAPVSLHK